MQVILQEDVPSLGSAGDVVKVKVGYGRNYLLPRKLAVVANGKNLVMLEHQKKVVAAKLVKQKKSAEEVAARLASMSVTIAREVGEEEKLFGSVTNADISNALKREGVDIDKHRVLLDGPIRQIGVYDVKVKLHHEVSGIIKVWVVKK